MSSKNNLKLVSLDSGGVRGFSQLEILRNIMFRLNWDSNSDGSDGNKLPCQHFDLIGGSGTGGLIVILLAKLRMSVEEAFEEFEDIVEHVFNPKEISASRRTEALRMCMENILKKKGLPVNLRLTDKQEGCSSFVVASLRTDAKSTICLSTYPVRNRPPPTITVIEAVLATCATQPEFAPISSGSRHKSREYIAASGALNPIHEVIAEAHLLFGKDATVASLLSIGAGHPGIISLPQNVDEAAIDKIMQDMPHDCEQRAQEIEERFGRVGIYSRFSVNHEMQNNHAGQLDDPGWIMTQTEYYLGRRETGERLDFLTQNFGVEKGRITLDQLKYASGSSSPGHAATIVQKSLEIFISNQDDDTIAKLRPKDLECESEVQPCLEGTRQDILQNIRNWVADLEAPNILWVNGYPGVGKSAIASTVVEELRSLNRLGSSFFFKRDRASAMTPNALWGKVAYDLARRYASIREPLVTTLISDESLPTSPNVDALFRQLIYEPLTGSDIPTEKLPVIVLDAIDESGGIDGLHSDHRRKLMRTLKTWSGLSGRFKLIVTSRWTNDIKRLFSTTSHHTIEVTSGERVDATSSVDIRAFLLHELGQLRGEHPSLPPDWPGEEAMLRLIDGAKGVFIWIKTVIKLLECGEPRRTLRQVLSNGAGSMKGLYALILHESFPEPSDDDIKDFRAVLGAIIFTKEPFDAASLAHFLSIDGSTIEDIFTGLQSVLDCGSTIRFHNQSFADFLLNPSECPPSFLIDPKNETRNLTLCCLVTMKRYLRFNICDLESSYVRNQDVPDLAQRVDKYIPPYLSYSSRYWTSHLVEATSDRDINESLQYFMKYQFLWWLETMSFIRQINIGSSMLRSLVNWLRKSDQDDSLAIDMQKFVAVFASVISQSTAHIYISALPFAPRCLGVSKQYLSHYPQTLAVRSGGYNSWPSIQSIYTGHNGPVLSVAFSPDGRRVVSSSSDHTIRVWDAETGEKVKGPLEGHTKSVKSVSFSPDARYIVSGSADKTIRVWDAETGQTVLGPLQGHSDCITSAYFSPDGRRIVSGSTDKTIRVWDAETGQAVLGPLQDHSDCITSACFSPDGRRIVSGSTDKTIRVWDAETGRNLLGPLQRNGDRVNSVIFSPNGKRIASGSKDSNIWLWDANTGETVGRPLQGHSDSVTSIAFSPNGNTLVSGSRDCAIRIWDTETGETVIGPLQGHDDRITSVSFSPDGTRVVSSSSDATVRVWNAETGEATLGPLQRHSDRVNSVSFSPDGRRIVSGSKDTTILVWDAETGETVVGPLQGHSDSVTSVSFSPDGTQLASASKDHTVRIWDVEIGETVVGPLQGHNDRVYSVSFSPDGKRIVSGSSDNTIRVWNAETGETVLGPLQGHSASVNSVSFSSDGTRILSGSNDAKIQVWHAETGENVLGPLQPNGGWVNSVSFSPDGRRIVSGSKDTTILVRDAETGEVVVGPLQGHSDSVTSVSFSPDGTQIVSGSSDHTIRVWDTETGETVVGPLQDHNDQVTSVSFSPDGMRIVSSSNDNTIRIWNAETGETVVRPLQVYNDLGNSISLFQEGAQIVSGQGKIKVRSWDAPLGKKMAGPSQGHNSWVFSVSFSPDGSRIVSASGDKTIRVWDAETGQTVVGPLRGHRDRVYSASFSPDGARIVSGSDDNTIRVWDTKTGQTVIGPLQGHNGWVNSTSFSPDGTRIVSGSWDKTIRVWNAETGKMLMEPFRGHNCWVYSASFSPDGRKIVFGSNKKTIWILDAETGETVIEPLKGHNDRVTSVSFSPDGRRIVSGSWDKTIRVWDAGTGKTVIGPLRGHGSQVNCVSFSSDGKQIVSGSNDKTIRVWDAETGKMVIGPLEGHTDCVTSVSFSPDGTRVVSGSSDKIIRVWDVKVNDGAMDIYSVFRSYTKSHDGWILGPNAELLFWTPPGIRARLSSPGNTLIIDGQKVWTLLDFKHFVHGSEWSRCKDPVVVPSEGISNPKDQSAEGGLIMSQEWVAEEHAKVIKEVRERYLHVSTVPEEDNSSDHKGYSYRLTIVALNLELKEESIVIDEDTTFDDIGKYLFSSNHSITPVAFEQLDGPTPRWRIPGADTKIPRTTQRIYIADISSPFTLALVRHVEGDIPFLIPISLHETTTTVTAEEVATVLKANGTTWTSIRLLKDSDNNQEIPLTEAQGHIQYLFSTELFVLADNDRIAYKFRNDPELEAPLPLRVTFLQCWNLVDTAPRHNSFGLPLIHLSRALLHLIISLAEAIPKMLLGDSTVVRLISRLKSRVDNLKAIFVHIDNSAYPPLVVRETLIKYFHKLCREQPGVVSVRYSFDSFNVFLSRSMELSRAANPNLPDEEYDTSLAKVISPIEEDDTSVSSGSLSTSEGGGGD